MKELNEELSKVSCSLLKIEPCDSNTYGHNGVSGHPADVVTWLCHGLQLLSDVLDPRQLFPLTFLPT